jgi:hypothetical protein
MIWLKTVIFEVHNKKIQNPRIWLQTVIFEIQKKNFRSKKKILGPKSKNLASNGHFLVRNKI